MKQGEPFQKGFGGLIIIRKMEFLEKDIDIPLAGLAENQSCF